MRTLAALLAILVAAGCSSQDKDSTPTVAGKDPSVTVQAECDDDGVANVNIKFGELNSDYLIGKNAVTQSIGGGSKNVDSKFGLAPGYDEVPLTVTTRPTRGTCKTTLTDYESGKVVAESSTAGQSVLTVNLKRSK